MPTQLTAPTVTMIPRYCSAKIRTPEIPYCFSQLHKGCCGVYLLLGFLSLVNGYKNTSSLNPTLQQRGLDMGSRENKLISRISLGN